MCGFVTVYHKDGDPVNLNMLQKMMDVIEHRGPDSEGMYADAGVGMGFRRLSMIDLEHGSQPFTNENQDVWLTFNGEIYNFQELRVWLQDKGYKFYTRSDTEVLLRLYEEVGTDCPSYLRGMFAFAVWDLRKQIVFGARDHFGIKPLYYTETVDSFLLASEIKSLVASGQVPREVNDDALYHYLTFQYVPEPATMFKSIHKLKAGHSFLIQGNQMTMNPYYEIKFEPNENRSFEDMVEEAKDVLMKSVDIHRVSDVPRGAFLSGGVDSSALSGMLHRLETTKTFSVGFDMPGYSELDLARETAKYLGTDHREICITAQEYMNELPKLVYHMDEPVADPSAVGLYFVSKLAREHVKMAFSGEGADEFFGGYNIYKEPYSLRMFNGMPNGLRSVVGGVANMMPAGMKGKGFLERGSKPVEERFFGNAKIFEDREKNQVLSQSFLERGMFTSTDFVTMPLYDKVTHYDDVTKMQYIDMHTWLRGDILMKADKMSMANSLELRVPFVDVEVFKFASTLPTKFKVTPNATKMLLREAMKEIVPQDVQNRKKLGFPVPTRVWLRNEWYDWAKTIIRQSNVDQWINKAYVLELLEIHKEGKADVSRKIWTVLIFMIWHQIYIEANHELSGALTPAM